MELSIIFFVLYIAIVVIIGIVSSKKETEEDFMIANRKVAGIQVAATMSAGFYPIDIFSICLPLWDVGNVAVRWVSYWVYHT